LFYAPFQFRQLSVEVSLINLYLKQRLIEHVHLARNSSKFMLHLVLHAGKSRFHLCAQTFYTSLEFGTKVVAQSLIASLNVMTQRNDFSQRTFPNRLRIVLPFFQACYSDFH